ncbi:hypothetical protein DSC45_28700 [Streptomyces sp. YIM 130001]|uniref:DUF5819 family protein n=1 Tax=Streptomyces sp. YIM 130001 TaxID=2259644 RepID=UPI000EC3D37B|nr:DUF5819 family protein [Streptomyces sp. YIM 130001]RII11270.1 hypothetical protein DSC45_28700 [Streptomyces sp. YIM 130001]
MDAEALDEGRGEGTHALPGPAVPGGGERDSGIGGLSLPYQIAAVVALAAVLVVACVHVTMVFLHVAPANAVTKQHGEVVGDWIYPEFEQNWKLFAPDPLQQNVAVQARAEIRTSGGGTRETGWFSLSARDGAAIDGNLVPSHTQQNELRRAWDFYTSSHDRKDRANGLRGDLSERYLRRVVVLRLSQALENEPSGPDGGTLTRLRVRSSTVNVQPPPWSDEKVDSKPVYRELPWWTVPSDDLEVRKR